MNILTTRIETNTYRAVKHRYEDAIAKRAVADEELSAAKIKLEKAEAEITKKERIDAWKLRFALGPEERKIKRRAAQIKKELKKEIQKENLGLQEKIDSLRGELFQTHEELDRFEHEIRQVTEQFDQKIKEITDSIEEEKDRAECYYNQFLDLLEIIEELSPDKLMQEKTQKLRNNRLFIESSIEKGDYQAAIGLSQSQITEAIYMQLALQRMNDEFITLNYSISEGIAAVRKQICLMADLTGNEHTTDILIGNDSFSFSYDGDIDHWTEGMFHELCDKFDEMEEKIRQVYIRDMDLENMRIAEREVLSYSDRFRQCKSFAEREFSASCHVQGTAVRINEAVSNNSAWELIDSGFKEEDDRRAYTMTYADRSDNRISIVIIPDKTSGRLDSKKDAAFSLDACDGKTVKSTGLCRVIRNDVVSRIQTAGIDMGEITLSGADYEPRKTLDAFIQEEIERGANEKKDRLTAARKQMNLMKT